MQTKGFSLEGGISVIENIKNKLSAVRGDIGKNVYEKFNTVLTKNKGYKIICSISDVLGGEHFENVDLNEINSYDITCFKYAPLVSVDVERSFSMFKNILSDNRRSFLFDNLKKYLVIYCNANKDKN